MKSLYTVYDTSNRVLSLATVNSSSALDNIVRIPYGGVNNLYSAPTTLSSSGSSGGFPGLPGELGTGLGIIWLTLVVTLWKICWTAKKFRGVHLNTSHT